MGLSNALAAARLLRADPGLGGIWVRDRNGGVAEPLIEAMRQEGARVRAVPAGIGEDALLGGLDLAASLAAGRAVRQPGLIETAAGMLLLVRGAERMAPATGAVLAAGLEQGRFTLLLIDEGEEGERPPAALIERLAFHLAGDEPDGPDSWAENAAAIPPDDVMTALAGAAVALGVDSSRVLLLAMRTARAGARLVGRVECAAVDVATAARLVLAPRATRWPVPEEPDAAPADASDPRTSERLDDVVLEAAQAVLPADLLARIGDGRRRGPQSKARGAGERRRSPMRGRPVGARPGLPRGGARLALIDTIRAAAPWQALRRGGTASATIQLRRDDLRVRRFEDRAEALTLFAVDASGSSAAARLAEAKGAVELLLGRAYARRAEVALIAFRGTGAEMLLPPTRSLTRARRLLAELPGGGGTPLAAGLDAAFALAEAARRRGRTPFLVLLTDGRANVGLDGKAGRAAAEADATRAARRFGAAGYGGTVIDIGKRAEPDARRIAQALGMPCLHLPRADAAGLGAVLA